MGAGYHGGFGDASRYRKGVSVPATVKSLEMALNPVFYAETIAKKFNIHLKGSGQKIEIIINPKLPAGVAGKTRERHPNRIELGPTAFINEIELANTIAHELNHARSFLRGGRAPESKARKSGNTLAEYIRGER